MMKVLHQQRLAIWVQCPACGYSFSYAQLPPSKKWRTWSPGPCDHCNTPMIITKRRYYTVYAQDLYERAGTCQETCSLYYRTHREFRRALSEARRRQLAAQEQQREQERKWAAERALLKQAQTVARRVTQTGVMDAEDIARSAWESNPSQNDGDDFDPFFG